MKQLHDVIILGGGPAGYTAALYSARAGLDTLVLEKTAPGGQMISTSRIDNFPGFEKGIDGVTLGEKMRQNAERFGAKTVICTVTSVSLTGRVKLVRAGKNSFESRSVIIASGAEPRKLGIIGEEELTGRGISYCAACDGMLYRNRDIVIAGGGNSAAVDAVQLSRLCGSVTIVNINDTMTCEAAYTDILKSTGNIKIMNHSAVDSLIWNELLEGITVRDVYTGSVRHLLCDGLFVSIGRVPSTDLFRGQVSLDHDGFIIADETTGTNLPLVFAAGDVRAKPLRQIVTAVSDGAVAAHFAYRYLSRPAAVNAAAL